MDGVGPNDVTRRLGTGMFFFNILLILLLTIICIKGLLRPIYNYDTLRGPTQANEGPRQPM